MRAPLAQRILERADHRDGKLRELHGTDERDNVQIDVLPVGGERGALEPGGLATFEPQPGGLCDHDALAIGDVESRAHLAGDGDLEALGVALALEALECGGRRPGRYS